MFLLWEERVSTTPGDPSLLCSALCRCCLPLRQSLGDGGNTILQSHRPKDESAGIHAAEPAWCLRHPLQPCISSAVFLSEGKFQEVRGPRKDGWHPGRLSTQKPREQHRMATPTKSCCCMPVPGGQRSATHSPPSLTGSLAVLCLCPVDSGTQPQPWPLALRICSTQGWQKSPAD